MASDGGFVPDAPDISQTEHFDQDRDWLPDGDVMTARTFAPTERIVGGDEGLDWLPDGDVMTAESFAPAAGSSGNAGSSIHPVPDISKTPHFGPVPTPPPMPVSNGQGKYVPTPPPMPGSSGNSSVPENNATREWGSVDEFLGSDY